MTRPHLLRSRLRPLGAAVALLALAGLLACGEPEPAGPEVREIYDLVAEARWVDPNKQPDLLRIDEDEHRLVLGAGQKLHYFLYLPRQATLVVDRWEMHSGVQSPLQINVRRDGGAPFSLRSKSGTDGPSRWLLHPGESPFTRLTLVAPPSDQPGDGLILSSPRIEIEVEAATSADEPSTDARMADRDPDTPTSDASTPPSAPPNFIVYLVDTLRRDHLGVYGYDRDVSPNLDEFATGATVYDHAYAQSSWTRASVASIFTGLEPHLHGVNDRQDILSEEALTLAEILDAKGFQTAAFITNGNVGEDYQFNQGFEVFSPSKKKQYYAHQLNERIFDFLGSGRREAPLFLYAHSIDPHAPYEPFEPYRTELAGDVKNLTLGDLDYLKQHRRSPDGLPTGSIGKIRRLYDAEIRFNDEEFGSFLERLKAEGLYENSWIVFTSDHGEEFWEHGEWSHGHTLHGELIDIPLIVKAPGQTEGRRSDLPVQHIDLFATAIHTADADLPLRGTPLPKLDETVSETPRIVYSKIVLDHRNGDSIIFGDWKLIVMRSKKGKERPSLYRWTEDPGEETDLYSERPITAGTLERLARERRSESSTLGAAPQLEEMSEELAAELRALGYID